MSGNTFANPTAGQLRVITLEIAPDGEPITLTNRESEILALIFNGKSSKECAQELSLSKRTVDFHLQNCYTKLKVKNRMQAFNRLAGAV